MDTSYDPRCGIYCNGSYYYVSYYLPNGVRVCRSLRTKSGRVAKRLLHRKEGSLLEGVFDEQDMERMGGRFDSRNSRLTTEVAVEEYLTATSLGRRPRSQINDSYVLRRLVPLFEKEFVDDVVLYDIQILVNRLHAEGKAEATLKTYLGILRKFFGWLEISGLCRMDNPVSRKVILPRSSGLTRDRLPTLEEIELLISDDCEIGPLVRFLVFTGCRSGEALHMEWRDVLDGVWTIRSKPDCPTVDGMGWSPKWNKNRVVPLISEAIEVLESQKRISRWVFPKSDGSRRGSLTKAWTKMKERNGIVDLQIKDLRTWFNHVIKSYFGFSSKEASSYVGNSPRINELHYDPVSVDLISMKIGKGSATKLLRDGSR